MREKNDIFMFDLKFPPLVTLVHR